MTTLVATGLRATVFLFLVLSFLISQNAYAQDTQGIDIKPAIFEDRVSPGETREFTMTVTNISDSERIFYLAAQDITGLNDAGLPIFSTETEITPFELSSWVEIPESSIVLGPNASKPVSFTVRVPQDASPGSHFGGVFLSAEPPRLRETGATIGLRVGSILNLRIAGDVVEDAQLREFSTGKIVYGSAHVDFAARVANLGNTLIRPHGLIEIIDMRGSKIGIVNVNDSGSAVFPGADKTYEAAWEHEGFSFGRYQAVMSLAYGEDERKTISGVTSFWVLPLKPILTILDSIFAVILVLYIAVRSYINRKLREMGGGRGTASLYARRNQSVVPRLLLIALLLIFFSIAFLIILFLLFA